MRNVGKKPTKFKFTYQDLADITRLTVPTLRRYAHLGKFDPRDLVSVVKFVAPYLGYEEKASQNI